MSMVKETVTREIAALRTLRDELRVKAHLFKADLRDEWAKVEARFEVVESELRHFGKEAEVPVEIAGDAARLLITEAREALERIRERSKHLHPSAR
jgi:hypothetical protein